jgi:predicted CXXCH cytochrome family protein
MKRVLLTIAALITGLSMNAQTSVVNTKHNLSATGTQKYTSYSQVCKFCHSPHGANSGAAQLVPLWGHANTVQNFTMYASNPNQTLKTTTLDAQPSGPSLACLSCHDGTVAVNARYTYEAYLADAAPRGTYGNMNDLEAAVIADFDVTIDAKGNKMGKLKHSIAGESKNDLSTVHPIAIAYDVAANNQLVPVANLTGVKLFSGKVQCASCHDAHGTANSMFMRVSTTGSALCYAPPAGRGLSPSRFFAGFAQLRKILEPPASHPVPGRPPHPGRAGDRHPGPESGVFL